MHHIIIVSQKPYDINQFIAYKHVLNGMDIHLFKESEKIETFKTFLFVKLLNQDKAKDKTI
jgi:hypothetical protein